ncbi:unnamed protein product, partial [Meganyctiphanes norvegica]
DRLINMKLFIISLCALAMVHCMPQPDYEGGEVAILKQESFADGPNFNYGFESEDGTVVEATGSRGSSGSNIQGSYSFRLPNNQVAVVTYIADKHGFQPESDLLPQPVKRIHPIPQHALDNIRRAQGLKDLGVRFDHRGFRIYK